MRKRLLLILGCVASVLLAGYVTLRLTAPRHYLFSKNFDSIQKGMTEDEVEAILGARAGAHVEGALTGSYRVDGKNKEGWDLIKERGGKEWLGDDVCIYIRFDEEGRVAESHRTTYYSMVFTNNLDESFLRKLRRWLGM